MGVRKMNKDCEPFVTGGDARWLPYTLLTSNKRGPYGLPTVILYNENGNTTHFLVIQCKRPSRAIHYDLGRNRELKYYKSVSLEIKAPRQEKKKKTMPASKTPWRRTARNQLSLLSLRLNIQFLIFLLSLPSLPRHHFL